MSFGARFLETVGLLQLTLPQAIMMLIAAALMYLAIVKKYEPLLLLPIGFGMMIANMPMSYLSSHDEGGLIWYIYQLIKMGVLPPMIFLCLGALTDFGPLIASPLSWLIGIGGQLGIFMALLLAMLFS
jgi:oxaloacetate decarboxylase beta subunit